MTFKVSAGVYPCIVDFNTNTKYCGENNTEGGETPTQLPYSLNSVQRIFAPSSSPEQTTQFGQDIATFGDILVASTKYADLNEFGSASGDFDNGFVDIYRFIDYKWEHIQFIANPDIPDFDTTGTSQDYFGHAIALNGDYLVVGCPDDNTNDATDSSEGSIYIFKRTGYTFTLDQKFFAPSLESGDNFGMDVTIDPETNRIVVLSQYAVDVFENDSGTWSHSQTLEFPTASARGSDYYTTNDLFGGSEVVIRGDRIFASRARSQLEGSNAGGIDIYDLDEGTWSHTEILRQTPNFTNGPLCANSTHLFSTQRSGYVTGDRNIDVYDLDNNLVQTIVPPTPSFTVNGSDFGWVLECNDDHLIVGCPYSDDNSMGLAIVYEYDGANWVVLDYLRNNLPDDDSFGSSVGVSDDHYVVAATYSAVGDGYEYYRIGSVKPFAKHDLVNKPVSFDGFETLNDPYSFSYPNVPDDEWSNESVTAVGDYIFSGTSYFEPVGGSYTPGIIHIYKYNTTTEELDLIQTIENHNGQDTYYFTNSLDADGEWLVASDADAIPAGETESNGEVYIYRQSGETWSLFQTLVDPVAGTGNNFGEVIGVHGDVLIASSRYSGNGNINIFRFDGTDFKFEQTVANPTGVDTDWYGSSMDVHGDWFIVGAPAADASDTNEGASYIYHYDGSSWSLQTTILDINYSPGESVGASVSISDKYAVIGATDSASAGGVKTGTTRVLRRDGDVWSLFDFLKPDNPLENFRFGASSYIYDDYIIVGEQPLSAQLGRLRVYRVENDVCVLKHTITSPNGDSGDKFVGYYTDSIVMTDRLMAVVAVAASEVGTETGATYVWHTQSSPEVIIADPEVS